MTLSLTGWVPDAQGHIMPQVRNIFHAYLAANESNLCLKTAVRDQTRCWAWKKLSFNPTSISWVRWSSQSEESISSYSKWFSCHRKSPFVPRGESCVKKKVRRRRKVGGEPFPLLTESVVPATQWEPPQEASSGVKITISGTWPMHASRSNSMVNVRKCWSAACVP